MSYCRFSCDNWKSDVYCYESAVGYEIHVASNRVTGNIPRVPPITENLADPEHAKKWLAAYNEQSKFLETCVRKHIGGPQDGMIFTCGDLEEFIATLEHLMTCGYHVPDHAIVLARQELESENTQASKPGAAKTG